MNDLIKSFEALGWEFSEYHSEKPDPGMTWIFFASPRMKKTIGNSILCRAYELDSLTEQKIKEAEIDALLDEWKDDLQQQFYINIMEDMARQYKLLLMKGIEPPRSQKISFDVEFKL